MLKSLKNSKIWPCDKNQKNYSQELIKRLYKKSGKSIRIGISGYSFLKLSFHFFVGILGAIIANFMNY